VAPDQINLGWNGTINASSYDLYRSISSDGPFIHFGPIYGPAYSDTGLAADTTYYYQVTVTNAFGTSARSATASATTHVAAP
jgi:hypothetical protein